MFESNPAQTSRTDLQLIPAAGPACVHHWVLGEPADGTITGRCRRCAATRVYPAQPVSTDRFDDYRELTASSSYLERRKSA